jgi:hypothetical protein
MHKYFELLRLDWQALAVYYVHKPDKGLSDQVKWLLIREIIIRYVGQLISLVVIG